MYQECMFFSVFQHDNYKVSLTKCLHFQKPAGRGGKKKKTCRLAVDEFVSANFKADDGQNLVYKGQV